MKTILVPLDTSELAAKALPHAEALARQTGAEIVLLSVIDLPPGAKESDSKIENEKAQASDYLKARAAELTAKGLTCRADVAVALDAAAEILRAADAADADLIAIGSHGRSGLMRAVFGSVADNILKESHRPVLVIRPGAEPARAPAPSPSFSRILVPLDNSPLAETILPVARALAKDLNAAIIFLSAVEPITVSDPTTGQIPIGNLLTDIEEDTKAYIKDIVKETEQQGIKAEGLVGVGFAADQIVHAAEQSHADLIALATHGRSGIARLIMGSVADSILGNSPLPCIIIRPPAS